MERVSIIEGEIPIILVAPHGYEGDDKNTALLTELISNKIKAYAVINRGWQKSNLVDCIQDKGNCNNIIHCHEDVLREEFLEPILRFKARIIKKFNYCYIFYLHGMSSNHKNIIKNLDIVLGCGIKSRSSCKLIHKELMLHILNEISNLNTYEGSQNSGMSGFSSNNMNQLFNIHYIDPNVNSMQLEIIYDLRKNKESTKKLADSLSNTFLSFITWKFDEQDKFKKYPSY